MHGFSTRLVAGLLVAGLTLGAPAARAQHSVEALLSSSYALWGMMQGAVDFCWEQSGYAVAYKEAHKTWLARNVLARAEPETFLAYQFGLLRERDGM